MPLLIAAGSAAAIALAPGRRKSTGLVTVVAVGVTWTIDVAMLAWAVGPGVH